MNEYEKALQTYSWSEILEENEIDEVEALKFLVEMGYINLPNPEPL